jgi:hypothetical protein
LPVAGNAGHWFIRRTCRPVQAHRGRQTLADRPVIYFRCAT